VRRGRKGKKEGKETKDIFYLGINDADEFYCIEKEGAE